MHWTKLAGLPWYVTAVRNTRIVGPQVARLVNWLDAQGAISLASLHVIGFSLGAEIAGFMGKALAPRKVWKFRLSRVRRNFTFTKDVQSEFRLEGSQDWTPPILFTWTRAETGIWQRMTPCSSTWFTPMVETLASRILWVMSIFIRTVANLFSLDAIWIVLFGEVCRDLSISIVCTESSAKIFY